MSMTTRVAINGFGRIGRLAYRAMYDDPELEVVAINDTGSIPIVAHLLKYDSVHKAHFESVEETDHSLIVDGHELLYCSDRNPENLPWKDLGIDLVIESTGAFTDADKARAHIDAGAKKVLITAPGKHEDVTIVMGVNQNDYDYEKHHIVSNASCTTNCLAPFAKVLVEKFGIKRGYMNTIHAYTSDQRILDHTHKDLRRARAAGLSVIPTTTGAARAVALVIPELKGKFEGFATRVPVPDGSMVDLTVELETVVTRDVINEVMKEAAEGYLKGIMEYSTDPIVSSDVIGNPHSSVFDSQLTMVLNEESDFAKCIAWYDNEWGYSCRVKDLAKHMFAEA